MVFQRVVEFFLMNCRLLPQPSCPMLNVHHIGLGRSMMDMFAFFMTMKLQHPAM
jgi:hypothetical protein